MVVVQTVIGANDCAADLIFEHMRVSIHGEDDRHTEFVFVGPERTFVVAEFFGQHRQYAVDEINGSAASISIIVHFGVRADVERDIGYVDSDAIDSGAVCFL